MNDLDLMVLAVKLADQCEPEKPNKTPRLGVVITDSNGEIIGMAHRGKGTDKDDDHAELMAYRKVADKARLAGSTVYTTLEPCTHHVRTEEGNSCTDILCRFKPRRVFVGILDQNPGVCGKGVLGLQKQGIQVELFPHELVEVIKSQNDPFIKAYSTLTVEIIDHDPEKAVKEIKLDKWIQRFTFKCKSTNPIGPDVVAIACHSGQWWPQPGIFRQIPDTNEWDFDVWFGAAGMHDLVVVKMSDLGEALVSFHRSVVDSNLKRIKKLKRRFNGGDFSGLPTPNPGIALRKLSKGLDKLAVFAVDVIAPP
jgi:pyrimidine deaminase RibD-like protein